MKPTPKADYPILNHILNRWSPRAFDSRLVSEEDLMSLFEAARWASSCYNEQPWYFIITRRGKASHEKLLETLVEPNQIWAKYAPILMLTVIKTSFTHDAKNNAHAMHDLGLAVGNLSIQATSLGISLHQMAGFDAKNAEKSFKIPKGYHAVTAIALGYVNEDSSQLPEKLRNVEHAYQSRKKISEFIFSGEWKS